ncbi:MAG: 7-cyano-7-deazaguanine synthase QueC [Proteobacteria bacterium]|nr:7-cyano-7-deazaguanine synthase QueC [Pseudomonadota bacterium]
MSLSIVLLSGGLDSAVTAALAATKGEIATLHVNYSQRTEARELKAFTDVADFFNVEKRLIADISYLKDIGGSALLEGGEEVPEGDLTNTEIPVTYVPFRNAHLLSVAVSWAEVLSAENIYIGAVEEDSSGYPDCRREFFDSFQNTARLGTEGAKEVEIKTPLIEMKKSEIVKEGLRLGAPLHLTWSCYKASALACGHCDSCLLRLRGFEEAGQKDPIAYNL